MARKSIDFSQSLLQFQSQARIRNERQNRVSLPNINYGGNTNQSHNNNANRPINTTRTEQNNTESCSNNKVSPYALNNHKSYNESEVELIRTKYILQNKSLARSNSVMLAKINEMETTVGDLINENMRLRKSSNNNGLKGHLEEKMDLIESNIVEKVNEIFQYLKGIREKEGLMMNPQLDILNNINRPITSTPIDNDRCFPSFNFSFGRQREVDGEVREVSPRVDSTNDDRELETSTSFNIELAKSNSPEICIDQTFIEESSVNNRRADKFSTIIEEKEPSDSSKEMENIQEMLPKNTEKQWIVLQKEDQLENNIELTILPLESGKRVLGKHSVPEIINISDNDTDKPLESKRIRSKNTSKECLGSESSNHSQLQKASKKIQSIDTKLTPKTPQNAPKTPRSIDLTSIPKISESTLGEMKRQSSLKANSEEPDEISRPRRTRNVVDYKGVSLRAKMRRESAGFVDAVGENAMVNYGVVSRKTETPDNKRNSSRDPEPLKITQRKPLGNVTNTSQPKRLKLDKKEPIEVFKDTTDQENVLSVFDFEDETKTRRESVYIGKRTAKRNRRHTLMM